MRNSRLALLSSLFLVTTAVTTVACSSSSSEEDDTDIDVGALTDQELGVKALQIMGATSPNVPRAAGNGEGACSGCHSINPAALKQWKGQLDSAITYLQAADKTQDQKINYFRNDPDDVRTEFAPHAAGVMCAGAHLALGANVSSTRHPETYAQGKLLAQIFEGKQDLYDQFRRRMLMPVSTEYPRLTASEYEVVLTWFKKGLPKLDELIPEEGRPTSCTDDFTGLKAHVEEIKTKSWAAINRAHKMPMFGCPAPDQSVSPTECFKQQKDGKDIFINAPDAEFSRTWAQAGTVRILRELTTPNSFWLRSSADGRFAATGGGQSGAQAIDLQATLDGVSRDIGLKASYDPDFFPDNKAFMFQGGAKFCSQSLLEKSSTTVVKFDEPECTGLTGHDGQLYQTVGQTVGDNSLGDRFILYGNQHANDPGTSVGKDTAATAGADSSIQIFAAVAIGNDADEGYKTLDENPPKIPMPYRGDTMMGRSGTIIGSRVSGEGGASLGYSIEKLNKVRAGNKYAFTTAPLGRVCMQGNKANFSFDERFLATHHYNSPSELDPNDVGFQQKGSSDIVVADFVTGEKKVVTKMGPGQFALYPHFRSDGWLYFLVVDKTARKYYVVASDWAVRQAER